MSFDASIPQSRRVAAFTAVIAAHLILLVAVIVMRSAAPAAKPKPGAMSVVSLGAPASVPDAVPPDRPLIVLIKEFQRRNESAAKSGPQSNSTLASASGCTSLDHVTTAMINDPGAVSSILNSPPETRSVADAIVLWNAGWTAAAMTPEAPLAPVRRVLERSLGELSDECLDEEVVGPRLVPIAAGDGTMFVVIGSGSWRWRELSAEAPDQAELVNAISELPDSN